MKAPKTIITVKDPDLIDSIPNLTARAKAKLDRLAQFGEYFAFELEFNAETGAVVTCKQVKAGE